MPGDLTGKQRAFAYAIARGRTKSDAYREAYAAQCMSASTLHVAACKVAANPKVRVMISELAARTRDQHAVTVDSLLAECDEALALARSKEDPTAMVAATRLKAMLTGLIVKERANARAPLADVTDEVVMAELDRLRAERERAGEPR